VCDRARVAVRGGWMAHVPRLAPTTIR
jgi:hypothetical protein